MEKSLNKEEDLNTGESLSREGCLDKKERQNREKLPIDNYFADILGVTYTDPGEYSPLTLAYIGDSVFDFIIKTVLVTGENMQSYKYHKKASAFVKAQAQSAYIDYLWDNLTETERWIYKRGRNTKTHSTAKNASVSDYRKATGFEAMIGYLYLNQEYDRLFEIVKQCMKMKDKA